MNILCMDILRYGIDPSMECLGYAVYRYSVYLFYFIWIYRYIIIWNRENTDRIGIWILWKYRLFDAGYLMI